MSQKQSLNRLDFEPWQAHSLRLTVFQSPSVVIKEQSWWEDLVGQPPEKIESNPREAAFQMIGKLEGTDVPTGYLILQIKPTRVDWQLTAMTPDMSAGEVPTIGNASETVERFRDLMLRWFSNCPPIQRIAFGAVLLKPVQDRRQGYSVLASFLPFINLDWENSSDFLLQVNRRRKSEVLDVELNRLSKWAVLAVEKYQLDVATGRMARAPGEMACRLELDINSAAEFEGDLPTERLADLFLELIATAGEIAREGLKG